MLEIQEASDITYRIYDYDRRDAQGNPRQLHVEESVDAIDFDDTVDLPAQNELGVVGELRTLADCSYFKTEVARVDGTMTMALAARDSFTILVATAGELTVKSADGEISLRQGETALVPASTSEVTIEGKGTIVSTYIP